VKFEMSRADRRRDQPTTTTTTADTARSTLIASDEAGTDEWRRCMVFFPVGTVELVGMKP